MRTSIFSFLLLLTLCLSANAQTIHWITFIDTSDWKLGADNVNGKRALDDRFIAKVNAALSLKGYKSKRYSYTGDSVTPEMCNNITSGLSCGSKDIVVFYYIGHGGRPQSNGGGSPWPEMEFCGNAKNYISLNTIHQRLKGKQPQLTLTFGMCCNVIQPKHDKKSGPSQHSRKYKIVSKEFAKKLQHLFLYYKGDIQIAAASAGQLAQGGFLCVEGEMDYFTGSLCMLMDSYAASSKKDIITWQRFMGDLAYWTHYRVKQEVGEEQMPYYRINVSQINK